jgi:putative PIN family toxin of toxin-antitoxin system
VQILLDTNVIISGLLSGKGPPGQLLQAWLDGRFDLVTSHLQLDELRRALGYEKLRDRINPAQVRDFVDNIVVMAVIVPSVTAVAFSPDPDDNLILATAIAGHADLIVSGDRQHMLALREVEGIPIVTPREALSRLEAEGRSI